MRFLLYGLFLIFWFVMWWWTYTCHIKFSCCGSGVSGDPISLIEVDRQDRHAVVFRWSEARPVATVRFDMIRDSLLNALSDGQILQITGLYYRDEEMPAEGGDLGTARAVAVRSILADALPGDRIIVKSEVVDLPGDVRDRFFNAVEFRALLNNAHVKERDDHALIYFPFNSTEPELSEKIHDYLDAVIRRLAESGEHVVLTGHTDTQGTQTSNYYLGHWRATALKDALVEKGLDEERITVTSKGEGEPLTTNNSATSKELNRRVELRLTNPNQE